jgi:SAM-dependent methyltransferase
MQKKDLIKYMNSMAEKRDRYIRRNALYYHDLVKFLKFNIPSGSSILEVGCGTGYLLNALQPGKGVGIDISPGMISVARKNHPHLAFHEMDVEFLLPETLASHPFDFIIISDTIGYFEDVMRAFSELRKVTSDHTRIIITYPNFFWLPILDLAGFLRLKMVSKRFNWLDFKDISNILHLEGFEMIKTGRRFLFPKYFPVISSLFNRYLAFLPGFNFFCLTDFVITRPVRTMPLNEAGLSVSVIIPARNEQGNIANAIRRMPQIGSHTEIIFIEGHSTDNTFGEIVSTADKYCRQLDIKYARQSGKGKGDAVRQGFAMASGDILMILDADLTVPPEDLPKFYNAIADGYGEFINGTRLVYPMERQAMRTLNMMGNKLFSFIFSWLLGQRIKDTLCGTKAISRVNWNKLVKNRSYFGDFDPFGDFDLIFGAAKLNLKIVEIPIRYRAREYGETNISRFKHGWLLLKMVFFALNKIKFK